MPVYVEADLFWEEAAAVTRERAREALSRGHGEASAYLEALASTFAARELEARYVNGSAPEATTQERAVPGHITERSLPGGR